MAIVRFGLYDDVTIVDGVRIENITKGAGSQRVIQGEDSLSLRFVRVVNVIPPSRPAYKLVLYLYEDGEEELLRMPVIGWAVTMNLSPACSEETYWAEAISMDDTVAANSSSVVICDGFWSAGTERASGMGEESALEYLRKDAAEKVRETRS
jgi:hypothetical protein